MKTPRAKVGVDLSPIGFRSRAPGTATHVENQVQALLALEVEWDWVLVATPRALAEAPFFRSFDPILSSDAPLTYHVCLSLGRIWAKTRCDLGLATAFFVPFTGPPVVTNYFDANAQHSVRDYRNLNERLKWHALQRLCRFSRNRSRALFTLSNYARSVMATADPANAHKWVVTPCGCPPLDEQPEASPVWAKQLNGKSFILYAGAISENKNQRRLIEAWDKLRRRYDSFPALVLIGPSPANYMREVIQPHRSKVAYPEELVIPGFVSKQDVTWAFYNAHSYIQPSFAEGFGMPVIEAMSCGVPVACSDSTSLPEVAGDAAIFFDPSDVNSIANTLETLILDKQKREVLKERGLKRAELFTWKQHAETVAQTIRQQLNSAR